MLQGQFDLEMATPVDASAIPDVLFERGLYWASGRSGVVNLVAAHKWFNLAALKGRIEAIALRHEVAEMMSETEIAIAQRQREIALLRAVAATPRQVRRLVGRETLLVALAASLAGILPGAALAGALGHALAGHGIAPEDMKVELGLIPALIAVAGTMLTAQAAVIAKYWIMRLPLLMSFSTGRSAIARRPSSRAASLRPRAASINPRTHSAGP